MRELKTDLSVGRTRATPSPRCPGLRSLRAGQAGRSRVAFSAAKAPRFMLRSSAAIKRSDKQKEGPDGHHRASTQQDGSFVGSLTTLTVKAKATISPIDKTRKKSPDFRVYGGNAEIGAAVGDQQGRQSLPLGQAGRSASPSRSLLLCRALDKGHALVWTLREADAASVFSRGRFPFPQRKGDRQ